MMLRSRGEGREMFRVRIKEVNGALIRIAGKERSAMSEADLKAAIAHHAPSVRTYLLNQIGREKDPYTNE